MKVTAKTIAEQLGVSAATVDRVLHNRGGVSHEMLIKVREKAQELNYTPNKSASFLARKKEIHVAFVFPEEPAYFFSSIEKGIKNALEDLQDYGFYLDIIKTPHAVEPQLEIVEDIINSDHYDGLAFSPIDASPLVPVIDSGIEKGFPIYTFNNDSPTSKRLSFVGADYLDSGRLAGELLYNLTGSSKKFALISGKTDIFQLQQKIMGFREFTTRYNNVEIIGPLKIDFTNLESSILGLESYLQKVDGIYVASGALAEVAEALEKMSLQDKPVVVGHDMSNEIYDYFQKDIVTASVCQDPVYQGDLTVRTVFKNLMLERKIEKVKNIVKLEIVSKGNAKYYLS